MSVETAKEVLTDVVTSQEWLQAARLSLGLASVDDLCLVEVKGRVTVGDGSEEVEGFIGETLPLRVRVRVGGGEEKEVALFLKTVPTGNASRTAMAVGTGAFRKESGYYQLMERLSPRLPAPHRLPAPWAPRCFIARDTALVFEDLGAQGYKTLGMRSSLDFEHCAAALDAVARLHAASLALEEADRPTGDLNPWQLGDRFKDILQEVMLAPVDNILSKGFFFKGMRSIQTIVSLMPEYKKSPRYKEIVDKVENKLPAIAYWCVKASEKYRNVLLHGDIWINNIMFKHSSDGKVAEARLVDFQLTRYGPPALDVEMLLALSMRRQLREERADELRDVYYLALRGALLRAGVEPDDLMPRAHFDACQRQGEVLGRILATIYCTADYLPAEVTREVYATSESLQAFLSSDDDNLIGNTFSHNDDYRERIGELVKELVDNVLLDDNLNI